MLNRAASAAGMAAGKAAAIAVDAGKATAAAAKQADEKYSITQQVGAKATAAKASVVAKVTAVPPEERQKMLNTASVVLSTASLFGGPKVKAASCAVGAAAAVHQTQVPASTVVQVQATVDAGGEMTIGLESGECFVVQVPPGVMRGQLFEVEVPLPPSCGGGGGAGMMGSASGAAMAAMTAAASGAAAAAATSAVSRSTGLTPGQSQQAMRLANDVGLTPAEAVKAGVQGVKVAKDLGLTPTDVANAAKMGASVARAFK